MGGWLGFLAWACCREGGLGLGFLGLDGGVAWQGCAEGDECGGGKVAEERGKAEGGSVAAERINALAFDGHVKPDARQAAFRHR